MALYFMKEVACCVLLATALVGSAAGIAMAWKVAGNLAGGIRQARAHLT
jgi:hypothetical protein